MANRCNATDCEAGSCSNVVGVGLGYFVHSKNRGKLRGVDAMTTRGDNKYRFTVGEKDERTRDLPNFDA
jgi:hypothetical protein